MAGLVPFLVLLAVVVVSLPLLPRLSGWTILAARFASPAPRESMGRTSVQLGEGWLPMRYRRFKAGCDAQALWITPIWPLRLTHPPLLIPWSAIDSVEIRRMGWVDDTIVRVTGPESPRLVLRGGFGQAVYALWQQRDLPQPESTVE